MPTHHDEPLLERYQREHRTFEGMNMSEHTDGSIRYDYEPGYCGEFIASNGTTVCTFADEPSEADARRLVACWNWCDGLSTENLEDNIPAIELAKRYNEVIRERDRLSAINAELMGALERALPFMEAESVISGYGYFRPSNPNNFNPDPESCTEAEIANHKAACEAYDAGNYRDDCGDGWLSPTMHVTKAPWGIGSYNDPIPELEEQCERARAAIAKAQGAQP